MKLISGRFFFSANDVKPHKITWKLQYHEITRQSIFENPSYMQWESTVFRDESTSKAHVGAVDKWAGIAHTVNHTEVDRVTSCRQAGLHFFHCPVHTNKTNKQKKILQSELKKYVSLATRVNAFKHNKISLKESLWIVLNRKVAAFLSDHDANLMVVESWYCSGNTISWFLISFIAYTKALKIHLCKVQLAYTSALLMYRPVWKERASAPTGVDPPGVHKGEDQARAWTQGVVWRVPADHPSPTPTQPSYYKSTVEVATSSKAQQVPPLCASASWALNRPPSLVKEIVKQTITTINKIKKASVQSLQREHMCFRKRTRAHTHTRRRRADKQRERLSRKCGMESFEGVDTDISGRGGNKSQSPI